MDDWMVALLVIAGVGIGAAVVYVALSSRYTKVQPRYAAVTTSQGGWSNDEVRTTERDKNGFVVKESIHRAVTYA
jgi:hypothetical protein